MKSSPPRTFRFRELGGKRTGREINDSEAIDGFISAEAGTRRCPGDRGQETQCIVPSTYIDLLIVLLHHSAVYRRHSKYLSILLTIRRDIRIRFCVVQSEDPYCE